MILLRIGICSGLRGRMHREFSVQLLNTRSHQAYASWPEPVNKLDRSSKVFLVSRPRFFSTSVWLRTMSTEKSPLMSVQPSRGLMDEMCQVAVMNLLPNQEVTLRSLHQSEDKDFWEAFGHYISDEHGTVTVATDECLGGTYEGTEPMGLLWSLRPVPGSRHGLRLRKVNVLTPMIIHISVYDGHLSQDFSRQAELATIVTERWYIAPGVQRVDVGEKGLQATLFLPPGPGPYPGVLDLWGGGGRLNECRSALLASHGFASLALEYMGPREVKSAEDNALYFEKAYQILQNHPKVQKDRLAMVGLSFGGAVTLIMAATSKIIKPQCCVCIGGTHVFRSDISPFEVLANIKKNIGKMHVNEENQFIHRHLIPIPSDKALKVDVGKVKCPLLLVTGTDDLCFPAVESAEDIKLMMEKAGNLHLLEVLTYPGAGHLIEPPYIPHVRASNFIFRDKTSSEKVLLLWGGQTKPHAYAQEDAWKNILAFLQQHLYFSSNVKKSKGQALVMSLQQ